MDPQTTKDGKPWGPERFREIVRERYLISKHINTSYGDVGNMTPLERDYVLSFIAEDAKKAQEALEKNRAHRKK